MNMDTALGALRRGLVVPGPTVLHKPAILRLGRKRTHDNLLTYDAATIDSLGAFLNGELERLDQNLHMPLAAVTWGRDIDIREDVTIADEASSFTNSSFASAGGIVPAGKAWVTKEGNAITGVSVDIAKTANPLTLWGMEIGYTLPELSSSQRLGRPIDQQKYSGMRLKYNMDTDEQVYIGDSGLGQTGLVNHTSVTPSNVVAGAGGNTEWAKKSADEILTDINDFLEAVWASAAYARVPRNLLLPPTQFSSLVSRKVSSAGNVSVLEYCRVNSITNAVTGTPLNIQPLKWLTGRGAGGTPFTGGTVDRMVAYTRDMELVRFPMTLMAKTPIQYRGLQVSTYYYCRLGVVEVVYPETIGYRDGI